MTNIRFAAIGPATAPELRNSDMDSIYDALSFRYAELRDVPAIVALVTSGYRGDASRVGWTTEADFLEGSRTDANDVAGMIKGERSIVLLGVQDGSIIACAHITVDGGTGYFGMFAVNPLLQGGGAGKRVLAEAERIVHEEWGLPAMHMTVIDIRYELIAFYERRGYRRTGSFRPFPYGDERFGTPLRKDLRFALLEKAFS